MLKSKLQRQDLVTAHRKPSKWQICDFSYDESGNCNGEVLRPPATATKLRWEIPDDCANIMRRSLSVAKEAIDDLDLWIEVMDRQLFVWVTHFANT